MLLSRQVDEYNLEVTTRKEQSRGYIAVLGHSVLNCLNPNTKKLH